MTWLRLGLLEVRVTLRDLIQRRWLRRVIVVLCLAAVLAVFGLVLLAPRPSDKPVPLGAFLGLLGMNLVLGAGAATWALSALVTRPERFRLLTLSPLSRGAALSLSLAPAVVAATLPLGLLGPLTLAAAVRSPDTALLAGGAAVCTFGWAVVIALASATQIVQRFERTRAAQLLRASSGVLMVGVLLAIRKVVRLELPEGLVVALLILTPLLLPVVAARAGKAFVAALAGGGGDSPSREPSWGHTGWGRELWRSLSAPALLGVVAPALLLAWRPEAMPALVGSSGVVVVTAPFSHLLGPEWERPERLTLAPRGAQYLGKMVALCGGGAALLAIAAFAVVGFGQWRWLYAVSLVALLTVPTALLGSRILRNGSQVVLLLLAGMSQALWQ